MQLNLSLPKAPRKRKRDARRLRATLSPSASSEAQPWQIATLGSSAKQPLADGDACDQSKPAAIEKKDEEAEDREARIAVAVHVS